MRRGTFVLRAREFRNPPRGKFLSESKAHPPSASPQPEYIEIGQLQSLGIGASDIAKLKAAGFHT